MFSFMASPHCWIKPSCQQQQIKQLCSANIKDIYTNSRYKFYFFQCTDQLQHTSSSKDTDDSTGLDKNVIPVQGSKHDLKSYTSNVLRDYLTKKWQTSAMCFYVTEVFSPSVSMFWSGISKLISIMLDSFQEPLNMLEKYPDCKKEES